MCHVQTLSDADLLAVMVGPVSARKVMKSVEGSLVALLNESIVPYDVDPKVQRQLRAAKELVRRSLVQSLKERDCLSSPHAVRDYLRVTLAGRDRESFLVLFLDAQNRVLTTEELFRGTLTETSVYPREVVRRSLHHNAAAVILAHNHPSGVVEPSRADEALTRTLKAALALVDIAVLDHIIVGADRSLSFAERGLM